jgi:hypothetical protein
MPDLGSPADDMEIFRRARQPPPLLLRATVVSARQFEEAGFGAIAARRAAGRGVTLDAIAESDRLELVNFKSLR